METTELAPDVSQLQTDQPQSSRSADSKNVAPGDKPDSSWAPDNGRRVTLEEYWEKWYENPYPDLDVSYEWNNGILEAKPLPNAPQLGLYNWFLALLLCNLETFDHASLINLETGFMLTIDDDSDPSGERVQVRKPDIGVILNTNPVSWGELDQRHFDGVCDMVVEAVSDSTLAEVLRDTVEKREDYALGGVKEYYILDPGGERMRFYALNSEGEYEEIPPDPNGVIRSKVLSGLQFRLDDLHRRPRLAELARDDVYSDYVIPELQVAVTRAEEAEEQVKALEAELASLRKKLS
ncbi:MAG: Uma2 family endonuclease [Caldilineaceae bacterium SB0665_bin_25]|nr:Uma2 family endonuclease [Caldilineaceae bacterium SB0665_bin_25]